MEILRHSGGSTLADLRRDIGLSPTAIRQQLTLLERDGLVHRALVHGRPGRPPIVYQPSPAAGPPSGESFTALLGAVFKSMRDQAPDRFEQMLEDVANRLATGHSHIARLPGEEARIRAALAILFDATAEAEVSGGGRDYAVVLRTCSLVPVAREFPSLCAITRRLLGTLVGADVTQLESIVRGDPRCLFRLTIPGGARVAN